MEKPKIFICECHSLNHIFSFWYDDEYHDIHFEPHLITYRNIFKRIWRAIGYVFGRKSNYGDFDSMIFNRDDYTVIRAFLDRAEIDSFYSVYPEIVKHGVEVWDSEEDFNEWLLSKTPYSEGYNESQKINDKRVIAMPSNEIDAELGRIEHGIFG